MVHGYRSGTYPITAKSWQKLEAAELAAGIEPIPVDENCENAVRDREVEYRVTPSPPIFSPPPALERVRELSDQVAKIQAELAGLADLGVVREFPMDELISRMKAAGAWPPSKEDGKLSPSVLMLKYPAPKQPNQ